MLYVFSSDVNVFDLTGSSSAEGPVGQEAERRWGDGDAASERRHWASFLCASWVKLWCRIPEDAGPQFPSANSVHAPGVQAGDTAFIMCQNKQWSPTFR